jgi:putative ubiquitin-RnfH superfamily antitoxin RatB of RatAB toxin-antitoxin module
MADEPMPDDNAVEDAGKASVEVVYATPDVQRVVEIPFTKGLMAIQAVERSGLIDEFPQIDSSSLILGVFGERIELERVLETGERVEICRPLQQDPRDMRSSLAAKGGVMGRPKESSSE